MANEPVLVCANVKGPQKAYEVLRDMPWDRLSHANISSNVKWNASLGQQFGNPDVDVVYAGTLRNVDNGFALPPAEYRVRRKFGDESFLELVPKRGFPLELVYAHNVPRTMGLDIQLPSDNPEAAKSLIGEIIRNLIVSGFSYSTYPLVDAMVFAEKDLVRRIERGERFEPLLIVDRNGLRVNRKDVNGVRVFTEGDLERMKSMPKEPSSNL